MANDDNRSPNNQTKKDCVHCMHGVKVVYQYGHCPDLWIFIHLVISCIKPIPMSGTSTGRGIDVLATTIFATILMNPLITTTQLNFVYFWVFLVAASERTCWA